MSMSALYPVPSVSRQDHSLAHQYNNQSFYAGMENPPSIRIWRQPIAGRDNIFTERPALLFVVSGSYDLAHGDRMYSLLPGQIAFIKQGVFLRYSAVQENGELLVFEWTSNLVAEFARLTRLNTIAHGIVCPILVTDTSAQLKAYVSSLQIYFGHSDRILTDLAKIKLMELLYCLSKHDQQVMVQVLRTRDSYFSDLTQLVEENMLNPLSVGQLARMAGRSISSLRRDFLSVYNMSPARWIRQKKLEKAQEMLMNTCMTVTDICYTLGFENLAHFSRLFKSHFRYSPSELRTIVRTAS